MAPKGEAYNTDWIVSSNSNVHIATHRDWFATFTPFASHCGSVFVSSPALPVSGIGTVKLTLKLHKTYRAHRKNSHVIILHNVLFAPSYKCNVMGLANDCGYTYQGAPADKNCTLRDKEGKLAGLIESPLLPRLRLHGRTDKKSSLDEEKQYVLNVWWSDAERGRWEAYPEGYKAGLKAGKGKARKIARRAVPRKIENENQDTPYTEVEKEWLKKKYGGEYKFLRQYGLSIHKPEDREEGKAIVRSAMKEDGEKTTLVQAEDRDPKSVNDALNKQLQQLWLDDPMGHTADYNFEVEELEWIKKHYHNSANFMLSFGLSEFRNGDCEEAKSVLSTMMANESAAD